MRIAGIVFGALVAVTLVVAFPLAGRAIAGVGEPTIAEIDPPAGYSHPGTGIAVIGDGFEPGARVGLLDGGPFRVGFGDVPFASYGRDLVVRDGHVYLATNKGLCVFDVRDPENPVFLTSTGASFHGVDVSNDHAFLVNDGGLLVYDVSTPRSPFRIAWIPGPGGGARAVRVSGSLAYVVGENAFDVVDVTVPAEPRWVGNFPLAGGRDIEVGDGVAYVAGMDGGVHIVDIANPETPILLATRALRWGEAVAVALQDRRLFVVGRWLRGGLEIWDVDVPDEPSLVGFYDAAWIEDVAVQGDFAYLSGGLVLDVSDPSSPLFAGYARGKDNIVVEGDYAYTSGVGGDLLVLDVRQPAPAHPGALKTAGGALDVKVTGHLAYVATGDGLEIFDVSDLANPVVLGALTTPDLAFAVEPGSGHVFVMTWEGAASSRGRVLAVDTTDPSNPRIAAEHSLDVFIGADLARAGDHLVVTAGGRIQVLAYGDAAGLSVDGEIELPYDGFIFGEWVMAKGALAFASRFEFTWGEGDLTHFYVVDIGDPTDPRVVGDARFDGWLRPVQAVPGNPSLIAATGSDLRIVGDRFLFTDPSWNDLYVASLEDLERITQVLDVGDPGSPRLSRPKSYARPVLSRYRLPRGAGALDVVGDHALVTEGPRFGLIAAAEQPDLADVRIVRLNEPVRDVTIVTPYELEATVPAGYTPGPYDVLVTNPDGSTALLRNGYRVLPNEPPVARACEDATFECAGNLSATVVLDGSGSTDPDSTPGTQDDIDRFRWYLDRDGDDPVLLGIGSEVEVTLPLGEHVVTLEVTDTKGASGTDQAIVRVADTIPPEVTAQMTPLIGNGHARSTFDGTWTMAFGASDVCDPSPEVSGVIVLPEGSDDDHVTYTPLNDPLHSEIDLYSDPTPACPGRREFTLAGRDEAALVECLHEAWALGGVAVLDGQRLRLGVRRSGGASVSLASTTMSPERVTKKRHLCHYEFDGGVLCAVSASGPEADVVLSVRATDQGYPSANAATASVGLVEAIRRHCGGAAPAVPALCRSAE